MVHKEKGKLNLFQCINEELYDWSISILKFFAILFITIQFLGHVNYLLV